MRKIVVYLLGVLTGIVFTYLIFMCFGEESHETEIREEVQEEIEEEAEEAAEVEEVEDTSPQKYVLFDKPGEVMDADEYEVDKVISDNYALSSERFGIDKVLIYSSDGSIFYDGQNVRCGSDECFRYVGVMKEEHGGTRVRTIPIVQKMKK